MASSSSPGTLPVTAVPLSFPYPSTLNVTNFVTLRLTADNFLLWKTQFVSLVESQDLLGFLNGECLAPDRVLKTIDGGEQLNPAYQSWLRTDRLVKAWITGTLSEGILGLAVDVSSFAELWKVLSEEFSQSSEAREFELLSRLHYLKKKETQSLSDFLISFKTVCDQLAAIGKPVPDQLKVFMLLTNLDVAYDSFATAMLKVPVPSYSELIPLLHSHDLWSRGNVLDSSNPHLAFYGARSAGRVPRGGRGGRFQRGGRSYFSSQNRSFVPSVKASGSGESSSFSNSASGKENQSSGPSSSKSPVRCQVCKKYGHDALKCWGWWDHSYQSDDVPKALAAIQINSTQDAQWFPDSRATDHITNASGSLHTEGSGIRE